MRDIISKRFAILYSMCDAIDCKRDHDFTCLVLYAVRSKEF